MLAAWKEKGIKPPKGFEEELEDAEVEDAPELSWLETQYLLVFNMVATCRPIAFGGALPLPYTAICDVLDRNGWSGSEFQTAVYVVHQMDQELLRIWDAELESKK